MSVKCAPWPRTGRGLVAILRGLEPRHAVTAVAPLIEAGFEIVEVPFNAPEPLVTIEVLAREFGDRVLLGGGTVLAPGDVGRLADAGGRLLVAPNIDKAVMAEAAKRSMIAMPGVFSPSEAVAAVAAGASALKFFPASVLGPSGIKAISAVLPSGVVVAAVGGISDLDFERYADSGISLFGLGSSIFRPGMDPLEIARRARKAVAAWDAAFTGTLEA